jgi:hypothetical protein
MRVCAMASPDDRAAHLEEIKRQSQDAEEGLPISWRFAGEVLYIKPHRAGRSGYVPALSKKIADLCCRIYRSSVE